MNEQVAPDRTRVEKLVRFLERQGFCARSRREDYVEEGLLGYVEAQKRYEEEAGAAAETFGLHRAKGRILDAARREAAAYRYETADGFRVRALDGTMGENEPVPFVDLTPRSTAGPTVRPVPRTVESTLTAREMATLLGRCLRELPYRRRMLVVECRLNGRPVREVGRELGISRGRANRMLANGIEQIRWQLLNEGYSLADFV
jgi:RNA polymerase sigma factor (sigma-70 family)